MICGSAPVSAGQGGGGQAQGAAQLGSTTCPLGAGRRQRCGKAGAGGPGRGADTRSPAGEAGAGRGAGREPSLEVVVVSPFTACARRRGWSCRRSRHGELPQPAAGGGGEGLLSWVLGAGAARSVGG